MMRVRGGKAASSETARWERLILWGIVVLAVVLRAWGLSHQLPDKTYIEEDEFIYTALKYGSGDPNPHWFFHPPLYSYLLFALYGAYYLLGAAAGWFRGAEEFILQYLVDQQRHRGAWHLPERSRDTGIDRGTVSGHRSRLCGA